MNPLFLRSTLLAALVLSAAAAGAQSSEKISDAERAKRDADKVFSFIKFHTVKPAAAVTPAPKPVVAPPAVSRAVTPPAVAAAAAAARPLPAAAGPASVAAVAPSAETASTLGASSAAAAAASAAPVAVVTDQAPPVNASVPPTASPAAQPSTQPEPAAPVEEEEVPLKLIAYTPPEMSPQVMAAMDRPKVVVPVRFTVQADGRVSAAKATGNAPRRVENAAVRAVLQWRFEPLPAVREVDVEIAFNAAD